MVVHSLVRWAVLVLGVVAAVVLARRGARGRRSVLPFVIALDVQLVVGVALWAFLSPLTSGLSAAGLPTRRCAASPPSIR